MLTDNRDVKIINLDKISYGANPANLREFEGDTRYRFIRGDIADKGIISEIIQQVDVVVNFAAETHVDRSIANPELFVHSNILGVFNLLEVIKLKNREIRMIQISTDEIYGETLTTSFTEDDTLKPSNPYSATKASADMLCLAYHRTYELDIVITRCTNNFGPYQFPEKLIPKTIIRAHLGLKVPVYGSGMNIRDWIYVLDHCEALEKVLEKGRSGEIYNISSGNEFTNITVVRKILELMGKSDNLIEFVLDRPGHDVRYSLDSTKIRRELGWYPRHSFEEALSETVKWYIENEEWWKPLLTEKIIHPTPWLLEW